MPPTILVLITETNRERLNFIIWMIHLCVLLLEGDDSFSYLSSKSLAWYLEHSKDPVNVCWINKWRPEGFRKLKNGTILFLTMVFGIERREWKQKVKGPYTYCMFLASLIVLSTWHTWQVWTFIFNFTKKEASVSFWKQGNWSLVFMRCVQVIQLIAWQSHHWNPVQKVRFMSSLMLLTIKMYCMLQTHCSNALVYAHLLVGSVPTPSPTTLCVPLSIFISTPCLSKYTRCDQTMQSTFK